MSVLGIIAEYNPFHNGHKYHIEKSKLETNSKYVVVVMSGSFVQRGEPAFLDKWSRAKMAILGGADLVLELPSIYSIQTAELFAFGAVNLLHSLNIIDYLSFGTEVGDLDEINLISDILVSEPKPFKNLLKSFLGMGLSFPVSREKALSKYLGYDVSHITNSSNNILALEYLKSIKYLNSNIIPSTIKRRGENYSSKFLNSRFSSATGIRNSIFLNGLDGMDKYLPTTSINILNSFFEEFNGFNNLINYEHILLYLLRSKSTSEINNFMGNSTGLGNRIIKNSYKYNSILEVINNSISPIHTETRIQRFLIQLLLDIPEDKFIDLHNKSSYARILAANSNGLYLIKQIKKSSPIPIITKFANHKKFKSFELEKMLNIDKKSTDIFYLGFNNSKMNMDYSTSPYIKK